jgi:hypothetical protein
MTVLDEQHGLAYRATTVGILDEVNLFAVEC